MSKILDRLEAQVKRDGNTPEHVEVLKLYNTMIKYPSLSSTMLWNQLTKFDSKTSTYSINPEFKQLMKEFNC